MNFKKIQFKNSKNILRIIACALILFVMTSVGMSVMKIVNLTKEKREIEEKNNELLETKENLEQELDSVGTNKYIERIARKNLKLIKPNELLFIVPEKDEDVQNDVNAENSMDTGNRENKNQKVDD